MPQRQSASSPTQVHPHAAVRITGDLDPDALARCLGLLADTHPGLRARIDRRTGRPVSGEYANWTTHPNNPMSPGFKAGATA